MSFGLNAKGAKTPSRKATKENYSQNKPYRLVTRLAWTRYSLQCNIGELCIFGKTFSLRSLRLCAPKFLPTGFWLRRAVPGRGILLWEQDFLNRRKQREQSMTGTCPSLRCLCCLLFVSCVWLRLCIAIS